MSRTVPVYEYTPYDSYRQRILSSGRTVARGLGTYAAKFLSSKKSVPMKGMGALNKELAGAYASARRSYAPGRGRVMTGYGTRRPRGRRVQRPVAAKVAKMNKRISSLSKEVKSQRSELIYHSRSMTRLLSSVNQCAHVSPNGNSINNYELVLAQLRFFDSATPGTLVQADGSSGTYNRDYHFKSVYSTCTAYNNYQVPCKVRIYLVCNKDDTSIAGLTAYTNGLADVGNPSSTSPMVYLTDSPQFMDTWKICKTKTALLRPGQMCSLSYGVKDVFYNPSVTDSQTNTYQRKYKTFEFIVRVEGFYGHDSAVDEQGQLAAGVDIVYHAKYVVHYDAGGDLKYIYITDTADTFTNGGLISSHPVADNIGYSVG